MAQFNYDRIKDPTYYREGRENPYFAHIFYKNADELKAGESSFMQCLNGTWKFSYAENIEKASKVFMNMDVDCHGWDDIKVPAHIQMQGYDRIQYVNTQYPWDGLEDISHQEIPVRNNPVAQYVKYFTLPEGFDSERTFISFKGVESGMALWLNGQYVGYSEDSFTPSDYDLSPYIVKGENKLAVQVFKWTIGSWCEDQDFFRFSGIFRDVWLYHIPKVHVRDMKISTSLSEDLRHAEVKLNIQTTGSGKVRAYLIKPYNANADSCQERYLKKDDIPWQIQNAQMGRSDAIMFAGDTGGDITFKISSPKLWSAEYPNLYPIIIEVYGIDGILSETFIQRVGIRKFEIVDSVMLLNGKRIVFNGVNRHEFNCERGRVPSVDDMVMDIRTMKQNNINAIRTSHYPNDERLYDLCDEYGIYMIAENNMESHGTWEHIEKGRDDISAALPGDYDCWMGNMLDRVNSCYQRDKNHPAILIWSIGNESYGGKVPKAMHDKFHEMDGTRPVHYEGIFHDRRYNDTSDVESQMYTSADNIRAFLLENRDKPFISCEYAHAMGNSCGALDKYIKLTEDEPLYQGGFIWDYIDQTITAVDRYGKVYQSYGGDHDDRPTDWDFSGNGIVYGRTRKPSPKMQTVKYNYQNIKAEVSRDSIKITNKNLFTNTSEYNCVCILEKEGEVIKTVCIDTNVAPMSEAVVTMPISIPEDGNEYVVTVSFRLREDTLYAEKDHEVAFGQGVFGRYRAADDTKSCNGSIKVIRGSNNIGVMGEEFQVLFSAITGGMVSYQYKGREMLKSIPRPNFWRAPIQNDEGNLMPYRYAQWEIASRYASTKTPGKEYHDYPVNHLPEVEEGENSIAVTFTYYMPTTPASNCNIRYEVFSDGSVKTTLRYEPVKELGDMPEYGVMFRMSADFDNIKWYGMGPEETYADRETGAKLSTYTRKVTDLPEYLKPMECNNHTGVRYAQITDSDGNGLLFTMGSTGPINVSALPYSPFEMENATHEYELPAIHSTYVRCSLGQMGIAGDDTWGAKTHPEYLLNIDKPMELVFTFRGI